jgi:hypothetical protein
VHKIEITANFRRIHFYSIGSGSQQNKLGFFYFVLVKLLSRYAINSLSVTHELFEFGILYTFSLGQEKYLIFYSPKNQKYISKVLSALAKKKLLAFQQKDCLVITRDVKNMST